MHLLKCSVCNMPESLFGWSAEIPAPGFPHQYAPGVPRRPVRVRQCLSRIEKRQYKTAGCPALPSCRKGPCKHGWTVIHERSRAHCFSVHAADAEEAGKAEKTPLQKQNPAPPVKEGRGCFMPCSGCGLGGVRRRYRNSRCERDQHRPISQHLPHQHPYSRQSQRIRSCRHRPAERCTVQCWSERP